MSLTGILASGLFNLLGSHSAQSSGDPHATGSTSVQQEFQNLSQDLQSGNLSSARRDFAVIEQTVRHRTAQILHRHHHFSAAAQADAGNSIAQDFGSLAQALQSGNLAAAQSAFTSLQQAIDQTYAPLDSSAASAGTQPSPSAVNLLI